MIIPVIVELERGRVRAADDTVPEEAHRIGGAMVKDFVAALSASVAALSREMAAAVLRVCPPRAAERGRR